MTKTNRNQPCPCGSGKKYKACHGSTDKTRGGLASSRVLAIVVGIVVVGGVAIAVNHFRNTDLSDDGIQYDAVNNRYWDPAHGHWHDGPPPGQAANTTPLPAEDRTPEPYEYNAETDQFWDPEHGHWHEGRPPAQFAAPGSAAGSLKTVSPEAAERALADRGIEGGSGDTPAAWDYDAENDRHWNPNTGAWEPGMPPLEAFTSDGN